MRLIGERLFSAAAALLFLGFLVPSAASQSLEVEGLEMGDVDTSFRDQGIRFTTEYIDQSLSYGEVLVPDELRSSLTEVRTPGQPRSTQDGILVFQPPGQSGESLNLAYQYSGDVPVEELQGWTYGSEKGNSGQLRGERVDLNPENGSSSVLSTSLEDNGVTWDIDIRSHYEHLIVEYQVLQNASRTVNETVNGTNVTTTENVSKVVWESQDVYSGEEPELTPISARADANTLAENPSQSLSIEYDNRYDDRKNITFIAAIPENSTLKDFRTSAEKAVKADASFYPEVRSRIIENNLSDRFLLDDSTQYRFQAYNLTVPKDSNVSASVKASINGNRSNLYGYILGSTGVTLTSAELSDSTITDYNRYKGLNVTSASGTPTIGKAQPVYWSCGDDSTTGTGDIVIDCSAVDGVEDIAFYDTNGDLLNYEIESFSSSSGGVAWVYNTWTRDGDVGAYLGYGDGPSDRQDATGTWSNNGQNTVMVQHLQDDPLSATDSTGNNNDGSVNGVTATNGQYDGGAYFDGTSHIAVSNNNDLSQVGESDFTVTLWAKSTDTSLDVLYDNRDSGYQGFFLEHSDPDGDGVQEFKAGTQGGTKIYSNIDVGDGNWHSATITRTSGNDGHLYADGSLDASTGDWASFSVDDNTYIGEITGGCNGACNSNTYSGDLDDIKVYSDVKSSSWIQAEYDASAKAGKVFFNQNEGQSTVTNQPPQVDKPVVRPSSPVPAGAEVNVSVNASDPDSNLGSVNTSLLSPDGSVEVDNASMTNSTAEASEYYYSFKIPGEASSLGTWNATVYAEDTAEASDTNSTKFNVTDQDPPNWFNLKTNASGGEIFHTESLNISAEWRDNESGLNKAVLATNETGEWKNWTGGTKSWNSGEKEISTYIWKNESFNGTLAYRIWAKDTAGNWNVTDTQTVKVMGMLTESLSDSVALSESTSSYGDFFGDSSAAVSLSEALSSTATVTDYLETQFDITSTVSDTVSVIEELSTPFTISLTLDSQGYAEDKQNDTVAVTSSTQGQTNVSDTASAAFDVTTDMKVLGISTSEILQSTVGVDTETRSQTFVDHAVDSAVNVVDDTIATVTEHTRLSTNYTLAETVQTQANTSNQQSATIQVTETVSSYAEKFAEILTPINIEANTGSQANASTQISTDIGVSTGLNTAAFITETISTTVDVEEICWAGSPCYQDITGNQTQNQTQPSTGTGIIDGDGPLTIIKPVPIERSLPEWLQIYYQQNRNAIHGFALFLIAATGFLTIRKLLRFL